MHHLHRARRYRFLTARYLLVFLGFLVLSLMSVGNYWLTGEANAVGSSTSVRRPNGQTLPDDTSSLYLPLIFKEQPTNPPAATATTTPGATTTVSPGATSTNPPGATPTNTPTATVTNTPSPQPTSTHLTGGLPLVFVSRQIPTNGSIYYDEAGSLPGVGPYTRFEVAAPGKLLVREADGSLRTLIDGANPTATSLQLIDVNAPDVSYDGQRIVFAGLPAGDYQDGPLTDPGAWRIYTIAVDGTDLQQVTFSDQDDLDLSQFGDVASHFTEYDDTDPVWLPDGRIAFSSTRWPAHGMYSAARTSNLHVVDADGSNLHRITAERNGADRPLIDPLTGKIVYVRWWRNFRTATNSMATVTDPGGGYQMHNGLLSVNHSGTTGEEVGGKWNLNRNAWHLATINPDGTGLAQWGGESNTALTGELANHAYGGAFTPDGTLYANFFPMTNMTEAAGFGGIRRYHRGPHGYTSIIGITTRDEGYYGLARENPPSYGVQKGNYAAEPDVLPDGRLIISWAADIEQDYDLYVINPDGSNLTPLYANDGTTEVRARLIRQRTIPPILADTATQVASLLPPTAQGPYDTDGTFTFDALNVYFNAPVDVPIVNAIPVGSAGTIRFFIDHQRDQQRGSHETLDWPILLQEVAVNPDGSVTATSPANVPLFEQIRTSEPDYTVPLTSEGLLGGRTGAAHVAGMNFGRPGEVQRCVGCHAGHTMLPVPANPEDAKWTNLAPGAAVTTSSIDPALRGEVGNGGLIDRRVRMDIGFNDFIKYWFSAPGQSTGQWVQLTFPVPVTVRTVRLYNLPASEQIQVQNATVRLYSDTDATDEVAGNTSGSLVATGTDVGFADVLARVVRIELTAVSGDAAGLAEVEVIARGEAGP